VWTGKQSKNKSVVRPGVAQILLKIFGSSQNSTPSGKGHWIPSILRIHTCQAPLDKMYLCIPVLEPEDVGDTILGNV
jgi:hypothetical protein